MKRHLTAEQVQARGTMLQQMADSYESDKLTSRCPFCHRPYKTGTEFVAEMLSDPAKLRIINALAALEEAAQ